MQTVTDEAPALPARAAVPYPKVRVPAASTTLVMRPRLLELLGAGRDDSEADPDLTFLCAPAGSGKTTLLAEWAHRLLRRGDVTVAWVSLEGSDNDVHLLWSAVLAAIDAGTGPGSPVGGLGAPSHGFSPAFLSAFVDAMDRAPRPVYLVLDDVHELYDLETLSSLDLLLRRLPGRLRVVMSARYAPALALPRLHLEGRVRTIDATQLGFTEPEAVTLLSAHRVHLDEEELRVLLERTEGWAAGLRLAGMSLAQSRDPSALIADFASNDRAVADYLVGEVLAHQAEPTLQFLLATSVCECLTADLARELSGREDAGAVLDELERSNSFIVRYGRRDGWYRFHPMLREYLRAELARQNHERTGSLHATAARWFARRNETLTAIEHAVDADDADLTAALLEEFGLRHVLRGEGVRLARTLARASDEVARRPGVAQVAAATALDAGDPGAANNALARMRPADSDLPESPRTRALGAAIAVQRARLSGDSSAAADALAATPPLSGDTDLDLLTLVNRGAAQLWLGDVEAAASDLRRALVIARASDRDWAVLQCLSQLAAAGCARMDMGEASAAAQAAIGVAVSHGWTRSQPYAVASLALGWAAYQRLDGVAVAAAEPAVRLLDASPDPDAELAVAIFEAVVTFDAAENGHAVVADLRRVWERRSAGHTQPALVASAALVEQRMALRVGEPAWAGDVVDRAARLLGDTGEVRVLRAVLQTHRGRADSARRLLWPVLAGEVKCVVPVTRVEAWLREAALADRAGEESRSHDAVVTALTLAAEYELLRPFVTAGHEVHDLLARGAGRFGRLEAFAARLRSAAAPVGQEGLEALTARELQLLMELPSLRTADEIAASLFVSVNTVKTHLRGIYRKLGVNNRRQAIVLARRQGLL